LQADHVQRWLPLINCESRKGGLVICQGADEERWRQPPGCGAPPLPRADPAAREALLDIAGRLELLCRLERLKLIKGKHHEDSRRTIDRQP
jgi:hypothetical protein